MRRAHNQRMIGLSLPTKSRVLLQAVAQRWRNWAGGGSSLSGLTACERAYRHKRELDVDLAHDPFRVVKRECQGQAVPMIFWNWRNGRRVSSATKFCSPRCQHKAAGKAETLRSEGQAMALEMIGPMPGTLIDRSHAGSLQASAPISLDRASLSDVPCPQPRRIERVRMSIASPLTRPSPYLRGGTDSNDLRSVSRADSAISSRRAAAGHRTARWQGANQY